MSIEAMSWALNVPLGGNAKVVLLGLANHAHRDCTEARPGVPTLAAYACCDDRTVQRHLRKLEEDGWIRQTGWHATAGRPDRAVAVYALQPAWDSGCQNVAPVASGVTAAPERGDSTGPNGVTAVSPEPSLEPSVEPSATENARERPELPEAFPDELRPHLAAVCRVLRDLAERHRARDVKDISLASVMMARHRKPLVRAAHDFAAWADGRAQRQRDVVASYRNWLDRVDDMASVERLDAQGMPTSGNGSDRTNGNGRAVERRTDANGFQFTVDARTGERLYFGLRSWRELGPNERASAQEMIQMGTDPADPSTRA